MERREFIRFLGLATIACKVPLPLRAQAQPNNRATSETLELLQKAVESHLGPQLDTKDIYDFRVDCDDTNNRPDADCIIIDIYVKSRRATSIVHTRIASRYGNTIDEKYLNWTRYELFDIVGPKALAILEMYYSQPQ